MRALTEAERAQRREDLARAALEVFAEVGYGRLTVDAVARRAGISKGAVFLAFASKEDLVLHATGVTMAAWFARLEGVDLGAPPPVLARSLLVTLRTDPLLLPLLALTGPVLEQGCTPQAVLGFKEALGDHLRTLGRRWAGVGALVRPPDVAFFLRFFALIVGAWSVGEASRPVQEALVNRPDLAPLVPRFEELFVPLAVDQLSTLYLPPGQGLS